MTYTYDDIITAKDILTGKVKKEDIIGKWGWFLEYIPQDMRLDEIQRLGISGCLEDLDLDSSTPFGNGKQPFTYFLPGKEDPYEKRQAEWVKENGIKLGDKVKILRKFDDFESGCAIEMDEDGEMDPLVGTVGKVSAIEDDSIEVDSKGDCWYWPYFVLEKVENEPEAEDEPDNAKSPFKVGDKVRIAKEWDGFAEGCNPTVGETGIIDSIDNGNIRVVLDSDDDWWWYKSDAVELIKDESAYIPFDLSDPKDRDFLRGKWVKTKQTGSESQISSFKYTDGGGWQVHMPNVGFRTGKNLLEELTFLDGSVIGKPANKEN